MKQLIILSLLLLTFGARAQSNEADSVNELYKVVEVTPVFPGGMAALYKYLGENLEYPVATRRLGIEGRVYVQFVIDKMGFVDTASVEVVKGIHYAMDREAERVIKQMPQWIPGTMTEEGQTVSVRMVIPLICTLFEDTEDDKKKAKRNN